MGTNFMPTKYVLNKLNIWRRERDSNSRFRKRNNGFRDRPIQPLWHLSNNFLTKQFQIIQFLLEAQL